MKNITTLRFRRQKLFRNGGSQAVRIPKEMKFQTEEVVLRKEGESLIIEPRAASLKGLSQQMGEPINWSWEDADRPTEAEVLF